ncbi:MAG: DUF547 domain-containing protein [Halopseudomonas sp.]
MRRKMVRQLVTLTLCCAGLGAGLPVQSKEPDWGLYQQLLTEYVSPHQSQGIDLSWLDYSGLTADSRFDQLLQQLADFSPQQLQGRDETLAFYINAYNILAINVVRSYWPVTSIKQAAPWYRSVWQVDAGKIDGQLISLDAIEHQILRPLGEPRVHFAIVCASLSCPDLRDEPYKAGQLQQQLEHQAGDFIGNPSKGVQVRANGVYLSKIFDWFEDDFGGNQALIKRLNGYLESPINRVDGYLDYNWSVNGG